MSPDPRFYDDVYLIFRKTHSHSVLAWYHSFIERYGLRLWVDNLAISVIILIIIVIIIIMIGITLRTHIHFVLAWHHSFVVSHDSCLKEAAKISFRITHPHAVLAWDHTKVVFHYIGANESHWESDWGFTGTSYS